MTQRVYINGRFLAQRTTGVQRYAIETLYALDELLAADPALRAQVRFVVLVPPGASHPAAPALRHIQIETVGRLGGHAWEQLVLPWRARRSPLLGFGPTGPVVKRDQIITVHDAALFAMPEAFDWKFRAWSKLLLAILARRVSSIMTVSEFSARELARHLPGRAALRKSAEGWQHVHREPADAAILDKHGLASGRYFLGVSSLDPRKNFQLLVEAAGQLDAAGHRVVIVGGTNAAVFGTSQLDHAGHVTLTGYVSDRELRALYEHATAFVFPSRYEGFGLPPLEALALGCPVLASNAASIPEVCGDAAQYFDPDDGKALVALMHRMTTLAPAERQALIDRGRARAGTFGWDDSARANLAAVQACFRAAATPT
jgi:glycosyltransferase involved in cell wall biosynthesis